MSSSSISSSSESSVSSSSLSSSSSIWDKIVWETYGSVPKQTSLTIDILNKEDLYDKTTQWFGGVLPPAIRKLPIERFRSNILCKDAVWGTLETFSGNKSSLSNAVVLAGDTISIYIAPIGHAIGFYPDVSNGIVFGKTTLHATLYDVIQGEKKTVVFEDFELPAYDAKRYIKWQVNDINGETTQLFNNKNIYGFYVIEITETNEWFEMADWSLPIAQLNNVKTQFNNSSYLQVFALWWNKILSEINLTNTSRNVPITSNINFITHPVIDGDTIADVFDNKTKFPLYLNTSDGSPIDITSNQKTNIINECSWSAISSQLPLLTSDSSIGKLLKIGICDKRASEEFSIPPYIREKPYVIIQGETSEFPGLNGVVAACNLQEYLKDMVNNHEQSSFKIGDPARTLWINKESNESAIGFSMSSLTTVGSCVINNGVNDNIFDLTIDKNTPQIKEILVSNDESVLYINFTMLQENNNVAKVSYGIAVNNYAYAIYVDETGSSRSATFNTLSQMDRQIQEGDIVNVRIGIEDFNGGINYFYKSHNWHLISKDVYIRAIRPSQREDGSGIVDVFYDIVSNYEINQITILTEISSNYGKTFDVPIASIKGDSGDNVFVGENRHITWHPSIDLPNTLCEGIVFKLSIMNNPTAEMVSSDEIDSFTSGAIVVDTTYLNAATNEKFPYVLFNNGATETQFGINSEEDIKDMSIDFEGSEDSIASSISSKSSSVDITSSSKSSKSSSS